ncbi:hypothetical protein [Ornithinimicrobium cavernae]|uniref:hypothetical protein n=1 Tax=Ornithinimicrobium cavernae TaxID=2666047 RepID=UPI000D698DE2|nr:hypothetical protein [Ornithinimicrobium cavernae]
MAWWDTVWPILAALIPSAGLLFLFFLILKRIVEADRRERAAERRWEAEREAMREESDGSSSTQD